MRDIDRSGLQRILLIQLSAIGDVILSTPAVRLIRQALPEARIDFLTRPLGADALTGNPHLSEILVYPLGVAFPRSLVAEIRRRRYDAVLDFHSVPRTAIVTRLSGAKHRLGFRGRGPRNLLYHHLLPKERYPYTYVGRRKAELLQFLGIEVPPETDLSLEVVVGEEERHWAAELWERSGLVGDEPVVAVSAVRRQWFKSWGPRRWAQVADALTELGAKVLLTSGPGERPQVEAVVRRMRHRPVWDYGTTTIRQLAALYRRCALWVGNDGAPKHLAAATGTPTVTVVRWRLGEQWTDTRPGSPHLFIEKVPPQGCDRRCNRCAHLGCLTAIEPDEVLALVRAQLARWPLVTLTQSLRPAAARSAGMIADSTPAPR